MEHCNVCPVLNCAACVNGDGGSGSVWSGMVHRGVLSANLRPGSSELAGQGLWRLQFALDRLVAPARVLPRHLPGSAPRSASPRAAFRPCANSPGASGPAASAAQQRDRRHQPASPQRPGSNRPRTASTAGRPSPAWAWGSAAAAPPPPGAAPAARRPPTPWNAPTAPSARPGARSQMSVRWVIRPRCPSPGPCRRRISKSAAHVRFGTPAGSPAARAVPSWTGRPGSGL